MPRKGRVHANTGKTHLIENIPAHLRSPGRGHDLDRLFTWPTSDPPETIPVREAIPRWMRTTGCHWEEAAAAVDVNRDTVRSWLAEGARINRLLTAAILTVEACSAYELMCLAFSADVARAAAEVLTRWQSILERESRGGFTIGRQTVVDKQVIGLNGQPTGAVERTTTVVTETARPDTALIRWRMSKLHPRYRDKLDVNVDDGPDDDDEQLAGSIAADLRRFAGLAIDTTSTESENALSKAPDSPG